MKILISEHIITERKKDVENIDRINSIIDRIISYTYKIFDKNELENDKKHIKDIYGIDQGILLNLYYRYGITVGEDKDEPNSPFYVNIPISEKYIPNIGIDFNLTILNGMGRYNGYSNGHKKLISISLSHEDDTYKFLTNIPFTLKGKQIVLSHELSHFINYQKYDNNYKNDSGTSELPPEKYINHLEEISSQFNEVASDIQRDIDYRYRSIKKKINGNSDIKTLLYELLPSKKDYILKFLNKLKYVRYQKGGGDIPIPDDINQRTIKRIYMLYDNIFSKYSKMVQNEIDLIK